MNCCCPWVAAKRRCLRKQPVSPETTPPARRPDGIGPSDERAGEQSAERSAERPGTPSPAVFLPVPRGTRIGTDPPLGATFVFRRKAAAAANDADAAAADLGQRPPSSEKPQTAVGSGASAVDQAPGQVRGRMTSNVGSGGGGASKGRKRKNTFRASNMIPNALAGWSQR